MKQLLISALCVMLSLSVFSQKENILPRNSFGISLNAGYESGVDLKLDFKRLLFEGDYEFRSSISLNPLFDAYNASASIGFSRYLTSNERKVRFYMGTDLTYERFDFSRIIEKEDSHSLTQDLFLGLEYNPNNRLSLFLEQDIIDFNHYDNTGTIPKIQFLQGTSFGIKYRF